MIKEIPLTQGKFALVDDVDYDFLMQWKWYADKEGNTYYVKRNLRKGEKGWIDGYHRKAIRMHRIVLERKLGRELRENEFCDHLDGRGLNNQRDNLRAVDHRTNMQNRHDKTSSKYPGVCFSKDVRKYQTGIRVKGTRKHLGYFNTQEEAYKKYCEACEIVNSGDEKAIKNLIAPAQHSSKYKGVGWKKKNQKWQGYFWFNKKRYHVGYFDDEYEAHLSVEKEKIKVRKENNVPL